MKRTEPKSFAQIFDENMALAGAADTFARQRASFVWPEIVGPGINRYTFRRYVTDDGTLVPQSNAHRPDQQGRRLSGHKLHRIPLTTP